LFQQYALLFDLKSFLNVNYIPAYFGVATSITRYSSFHKKKRRIKTKPELYCAHAVRPIHTLNAELGQHRHAFLLKFQRTAETPLFGVMEVVRNVDFPSAVGTVANM
jgi:hypothetical protein